MDDSLQTLLRKYHNLTDDQVAQFAAFEDELIEWNSRFNLTAIRDRDSLRVKHFLDSLSVSAAFKNDLPRHLIDVGTGAGFPGIPLKILFPELKLTLVESTGKKCRFLEHMVELLNLRETVVLNARAEDLAIEKGYREKFDSAVARAVANLPTLCEYLLPLVKPGGTMIAQKGNTAQAELADAMNAIKVLGGAGGEIIKVNIEEIDQERFLVVINKTSRTPAAYPRRSGLPLKKPL